MPFSRGQLVGLVVGGGGGVVVAVILGYLIKRLRSEKRRSASPPEVDDGQPHALGSSIDKRSKESSIEKLNDSAGLAVEETSPVREEFFGIESCFAIDDSISSDPFDLSLTTPDDRWKSLSESPGICEVESPSFDELLDGNFKDRCSPGSSSLEPLLTTPEDDVRFSFHAVVAKEEEDDAPETIVSLSPRDLNPETVSPSENDQQRISVRNVTIEEKRRTRSLRRSSLEEIERQQTVLSPSEARALVAFLSPTHRQMNRALVVAANAASFPANRYFLRRAGCITALHALLQGEESDDEVLALAARGLANLALDEDNAKRMGVTLPSLTSMLLRVDRSLATKSSALNCLINLTFDSALHEALVPVIGVLLTNLDSTTDVDDDVRDLSRKLLLNVSTSSKVAPVLLSSQAPMGLSRWLCLSPTGKPQRDEWEINFAVGVCRFLANALESLEEGVDPVSSSTKLTGVAPEETLMWALVSETEAVTLRSLLFDLNRRPEADVRLQGKRLYALLFPLWKKFKGWPGKIDEEVE